MRLRILAALCAVLIAAGLVGGGYLLAAQTSDNTTTTLALCALKEDLQRRVKTGRDFLAAHPNGIPGIPVKTIKDGITNQQRTIDSLRILKC